MYLSGRIIATVSWIITYTTSIDFLIVIFRGNVEITVLTAINTSVKKNLKNS